MKVLPVVAFGLFAALMPGSSACYLTESCEELESSAEQAVAAVAEQNASCTTDADCGIANGGADGACAAVCGVITNKAALAAVDSAASSACGDFRAKGCAQPQIPCAAQLPVCSAGRCVGAPPSE